MNKDEMRLTLHNAHETLDGLRADSGYGHTCDPRFDEVLQMIAECRDALAAPRVELMPRLGAALKT